MAKMFAPKEPQKYMPFHFRDWCGSNKVRRMSLAERGAYLELLVECFDKGGFNDDLEEIMEICWAESLEEIKAIWDRIKRNFIIEDGWCTNSKIERVRTELDEKRVKDIENGRKGGLASAATRVNGGQGGSTEGQPPSTSKEGSQSGTLASEASLARKEVSQEGTPAGGFPSPSSSPSTDVSGTERPFGSSTLVPSSPPQRLNATPMETAFSCIPNMGKDLLDKGLEVGIIRRWNKLVAAVKEKGGNLGEYLSETDETLIGNIHQLISYEHNALIKLQVAMYYIYNNDKVNGKEGDFVASLKKMLSHKDSNPIHEFCWKQTHISYDDKPPRISMAFWKDRSIYRISLERSKDIPYVKQESGVSYIELPDWKWKYIHTPKSPNSLS